MIMCKLCHEFRHALTASISLCQVSNSKKPKTKQHLVYDSSEAESPPLKFFVSEKKYAGSSISGPNLFESKQMKSEPNFEIDISNTTFSVNSARPTPVKSTRMEGCINGSVGAESYGYDLFSVESNSRANRTKRKNGNKQNSATDSLFPEHLECWFQSDN